MQAVQLDPGNGTGTSLEDMCGMHAKGVLFWATQTSLCWNLPVQCMNCSVLRFLHIVNHDSAKHIASTGINQTHILVKHHMKGKNL